MQDEVQERVSTKQIRRDMIMEKNKEFISQARKKLMANRKVVCTGNPDQPGTLASGVKKIFPNATFLCRSTGWDLENIINNDQERLISVFKQSNTFLNCSYINSRMQSELLKICQQSVKFCDVINVGSTHEYDNLGPEPYRLSKLELRNLSLELNTFRFSTCHFILGGIKNNDSLLKQDWLDIDLICKTMVSIWNLPYHTPIMAMDQLKEPW